ncbi:3'-5' exonuclease [Ilyomonas limi]|uniref:3'-5' exonuclease n=1 Tax=Ilyomonas limi TaxID=2575867 RepID=A0A4U3KZE3_9BACT|nr:3'-5' exonuclease [Ilyomonas limi]TKK67194.1 3'-5' exonuclease [Ilyomonas limi]
MRLLLQRPVAFIDLETTGLNLSTDKIVEIAIIKIMPDGERLVKRKLVNPQMPISEGAYAIHGISDDMVKGAPTFKQIANEIKQFLEPCDIGGYNSNRFDIPMLIEEFLRCGLQFSVEGRKLIDVQKIFHLMEQRTLTAAYKFYCGKDLTDAHSAESDALATWEILEAQLERYPHIGNTLETICKFCGEEDMVDFSRRFIKVNGVEVFNFGKHKGRTVVEVLKQEPQYYDWMMKGDFTMHTKQKLTEILNRTLLKKV